MELNSSSARTNSHINDAASNPEAALFLNLLADLRYVAATRGIQIDPYTESSLNKLLGFPAPKKESILGLIKNYFEITRSLSRPEPELPEQQPPEVTPNEEVTYLQKALWSHGYYAKDDIFSLISKGDIVEIYNAEAIQVYRNFEFFRHCGYSFTELLTEEWFELYERPEAVTQAMLTSARNAFADGLGGIRPFEGGKHILREKHLNRNKVFSIELKYICPLYSKGSDHPTGIITTMRASPIGTDSSSAKIHML
jgi:hypothetical protein